MHLYGQGIIGCGNRYIKMNFGKSVIKLSFISQNTKNSAGVGVGMEKEDDFHSEINQVDGLDITYVMLLGLRCRHRGNQCSQNQYS